MSFAESCNHSPGSWQRGSAATDDCAAPEGSIRDAPFAARYKPVGCHSMS
jgi:hypothetical protein